MIMYLCMYICIYVCPFAYANTCGVDLNSFRRETTLLRQICRLAKLRQPHVFRRTHVGRYEWSSQS